MKKEAKKAAPKAKATKATKTNKSNLNVKIDKEKLVDFSKSALKILGLVLILLLVDLFVQYLNNDYSIAIVNGQRIPKREYIKNLERTYGQQAATMLIEEELLKQIGDEKGIDVSEEEIDESYQTLENQIGGPEVLQDALDANEMTVDQLREQLKNELVLKAIIEPTLEYTDEDLAQFFDEYKDFLYEDGESVEFEEKRDEIEKYYIEQKTFEGREGILSEFKEDSIIQINVPGMSEEDVSYGAFKATRNLISKFIDERNSN